MHTGVFGFGFHHGSLAAVHDEPTMAELVEAVAQTAAAVTATVAIGPPLPVDAARAASATSLGALRSAMATGDRSDLRTGEDLGCCWVLHTGGLPHSLLDPAVIAARERVDDLVADIAAAAGFSSAPSGHFLYPPGGYIGWHTNSRVPGRRLYLTMVDEPERSWFARRDPDTGEVVYSWDTGRDLRAFDVEKDRPLWHAVWSATQRHSLGYRLLPLPDGKGD